MAAIVARARSAEPTTWLFAAVVLLAGATLLHFMQPLTFWRDEWAFILDRRGSATDIDTYLTPFVEQLLAIPIAAYKLLIALFGIESALPFQLVSTSLFLVAVVLMFVHMRRRVDPWLALAATLPVLFLGPSWDDLLFPFQMSFFGSLACGIGALIALDREDRRGDVVATVLLTVGLFFSHVGIPFVVAAFVDIALDRTRFRRAFVFVIPTFIWLLWYLGWGREAQNFVVFQNFATLLGYVADGLASSLSAMFGLSVPRDEAAISPFDWGRPLLALAIALGVWRVLRIGVAALGRRFWALLAALLVFWSLTGLNATFFGEATSGRYQLMGVILWPMVAAELFRGARVTRPVVAAIVVIAAFSALANFSYLRLSAAGLEGQAQSQRGGLAALELTRDQVDPEFILTEENSGVNYLEIVDAASYFSAIDAFGSPAYSPEELADAPERSRASADSVFGAALGVNLQPASGSTTGCEEITVNPTATAIELPGPPTDVRIRGLEGSVEVGLRRYATTAFPVDLGTVQGGDDVQLEIPQDASAQPWHLGLGGSGRVEVCD